jgi:DNA mismatch endonuclease (patch repair protein)
MSLTRSQQMARICAIDTKPERLLRRALWSRGVRYRLHAATSGGRPDIAIGGKCPIGIFIDGCFFHGCPVHYVPPRSRIEFWRDKLAANVARDCRQTRALEDEGWRVFRVWEHEVFESADAIADRVVAIMSGAPLGSGPAWRVARVEWLDDERIRERRWLVDLRDEGRQTSEERIRSTKKVRAPKTVSGSRARVRRQ